MKQNYLTKLFELSQMLTVEAFASSDQETAAAYYDASHMCDQAALILKKLEHKIQAAKLRQMLDD